MKVGTDGVLLGAVAAGGKRILDIGTGTGLVAMMMSQRFTEAHIDGIDIDDDAVSQAMENVRLSPFAGKISVVKADIATYVAERYDSIVCNPPFFNETLECSDSQRNTARHTSAMPFATLLGSSARLLDDDGVMTIIVPKDKMCDIEHCCAYESLFITRRLYIKTVEHKEPKRVIMEIKKKPLTPLSTTQCLMENGERSMWYKLVTSEFYL